MKEYVQRKSPSLDELPEEETESTLKASESYRNRGTSAAPKEYRLFRDYPLAANLKRFQPWQIAKDIARIHENHPANGELTKNSYGCGTEEEKIDFKHLRSYMKANQITSATF